MQLEDMSRLVRACRRRAQLAIQEEAYWRQAISDRTDTMLNRANHADVDLPAGPADRDVRRHDIGGGWRPHAKRRFCEIPFRLGRSPR